MLRNFAWLLVVWGVAVWATWGFYLLMGIAPPEKIVPAGVGGGMLVAVGYWLERKTRRKTSNRQAEGTSHPDRVEQSNTADRPRE